jgi:hypothetical protein
MRIVLIAAGVGGLLLALAYYVQWSPVDELWPWSGMDTGETASASTPDSFYGYGASPSSNDLPHLSYYFLSSIFAAIALPVVWIGLKREVAATVGGAINLTIMYTALSIYMLQCYLTTEHTRLLIGASVCAASAVLSVVLWFWARRFSFRDQRPLPGPVRQSFRLFIVILILVGGALILKRPNVFPWPLEAEVSVVYGWIFLAAAAYFIYALRVPLWHNACGPLLGFLAYDVVLIVPFLDYFDTVDSEHRSRLIVYTLVVSFSGLLAAYYLFLHPATRIWFSQGQPVLSTNFIQP